MGNRVYLAGAIDYANLDPSLHTESDWQHGNWKDGLPIITFCPYCEAKERSRMFGVVKPDWLVMQQNQMALKTADAVVAVFDVGKPTFGTPIEVWERVRRTPGSVFLVHIGKPGLFVRDMATNHEVILGDRIEQARAWLIEYLHLPSN